MQIFYDETSDGRVTRVGYVGPDGSPMASSFAGWLQKHEIDAQLDRLRTRWAASQAEKAND